MAEVTQSTWFRVVIAVVVALALIALVGYARGDDSDLGRSPEPDVVVHDGG
jgi:hypothetical protein